MLRMGKIFWARADVHSDFLFFFVCLINTLTYLLTYLQMYDGCCSVR